MRRVCFLHQWWRLCSHLCPVACVSVSNIAEKCMNRLSWKCQDRLDTVQGTIVKTYYRGCSGTLSGYRILFSYFAGGACLLATLWKNVSMDFHIFKRDWTWCKEKLIKFLAFLDPHLHPGIFVLFCFLFSFSFFSAVLAMCSIPP